jgi:hypothetical protein
MSPDFDRSSACDGIARASVEIARRTIFGTGYEAYRLIASTPFNTGGGLGLE